MKVKFWLPALVFSLLSLSIIDSNSAIPPKAGAACSKLGSTQNYKGLKFTCTKNGKKLVWSKGVPIPKTQTSSTPSPSRSPSAIPSPVPSENPSVVPTSAPQISPTPQITLKPKTAPAAPTNWNDLVQHADGVAYWAWKKTSEKIESSTSKLGSIEISISPNAIPDNPKPLIALNLVSRFTGNYEEPKKVILVYAGEKDIDWGQKQIDQFCTERACGYDVSGEAKKACNVPITPCWGGLALRNQRTNTPMIYVTASEWGKTDPGHSQGTLEAHEYFHTVQAHLLTNVGWTQVPRWLIEGGATWVERATVFSDDFAKYEIERVRNNNTILFRERPNAEWIESFLDPEYKSGWDKWNGNEYHPWAIYDVGSLASEVMVAIGGPNNFLDLFKLTGSGKTFAQAFEISYGITWREGAKLIAKAIVAQQK